MSELEARAATRADTPELIRLRGMDVTAVDLHTTVEGEGLYRELGFAERAQPELRLKLGL